jgi:hypothetical protein
MGRPYTREAYENLLKKWNYEEPKITCECGKLITKKTYEKHVKTDLHNLLMRMKNRE